MEESKSEAKAIELKIPVMGKKARFEPRVGHAISPGTFLDIISGLSHVAGLSRDILKVPFKVNWGIKTLK